jgi:hypothetical protein
MNLSDHLRPLLRDHDCVIIPDFGGLVAEYTPAQMQPAGRHLLSPPTRQVAFNQALNRNDGLLLDALRQHLGLSATEAREQLHQAVAQLHQELQAQQRTELPGIGVFRQLAGRGLQFEYTGTENLLSAAFGLPELTAHPVAVIDARLAREQQAQLVPRLRSAAQRNSRVPLRQLVRGGAIGLAAGVVAAAVYLLSLHPTAVPVAWQGYVPRWEQARAAAVPQQAALVRPTFEHAVARPTQTVDPVEALLAKPSKPLPMKSRVRVGAATITTAGADNTAKPVPAAMRAATPVAATAQPAAHAAPTAATRSVGATVPTHPTVAPKPATQPPVVAAKPVATAAKPVVLAAKPAVAPAKSVVVAAKPVSPVKPAVAAQPLAAAKVPVAAPAEATIIKARTGRYYIMVAAYSSLARAEEGRRNLAHAGRPAKVILPYPGTRFYRLTAADYADRPTALAAAARLRQNPHLDKGLSVFPY